MSTHKRAVMSSSNNHTDSSSMEKTFSNVSFFPFFAIVLSFRSMCILNAFFRKYYYATVEEYSSRCVFECHCWSKHFSLSFHRHPYGRLRIAQKAHTSNNCKPNRMQRGIKANIRQREKNHSLCAHLAWRKLWKILK